MQLNDSHSMKIKFKIYRGPSWHQYRSWEDRLYSVQPFTRRASSAVCQLWPCAHRAINFCTWAVRWPWDWEWFLYLQLDPPFCQHRLHSAPVSIRWLCTVDCCYSAVSSCMIHKESSAGQRHIPISRYRNSIRSMGKRVTHSIPIRCKK